jgi:hypothetical protein
MEIFRNEYMKNLNQEVKYVDTQTSTAIKHDVCVEYPAESMLIYFTLGFILGVLFEYDR